MWGGLLKSTADDRMVNGENGVWWVFEIVSFFCFILLAEICVLLVKNAPTNDSKNLNSLLARFFERKKKV